MGRKKKYYCDFCNRYFNDNMDTRNKHSKSSLHLNIKKEHYNMFRDPETILKEESAKKPCRKFHYEGFCSFGGSCTFSHYSQEDLKAIKAELYLKEQKKLAEIPTVDSWLSKYSQELNEELFKSSKLLWSCELPYELSMNPSLLPPSLRPFPIKDFIDAKLESWG